MIRPKAFGVPSVPPAREDLDAAILALREADMNLDAANAELAAIIDRQNRQSHIYPTDQQFCDCREEVERAQADVRRCEFARQRAQVKVTELSLALERQ